MKTKRYPIMEVWKSCAVLINNNLFTFADYVVSNVGRIKRISAGNNTYIGKILTPKIKPSGYTHVVMRDHNGELQDVSVSRLVAHVFIGVCPEGYEVNHKDGIKRRNYDCNLEYVTRSENIRHAFDNKLKSLSGSKNGKAILNENDVMVIKKLLNRKNSPSCKIISNLFNVNGLVISRIKCGYTWNHV